MNYVLEYCEGCMSYGTYINDKPVLDCDIEELKKIAHILVDNIDKNTNNAHYIFQEVISSFVQEQGKYMNLGVCECCGDIIEKYTMHVSDKKK